MGTFRGLGQRYQVDPSRRIASSMPGLMPALFTSTSSRSEQRRSFCALGCASSSDQHVEAAASSCLAISNPIPAVCACHEGGAIGLDHAFLQKYNFERKPLS
jgi:hypothetical protein